MSEQFEPHAELPPEPMLSEAETRRLVERLEAQIKETEQLERARDTRPQPSAEPVAYAVAEAAYSAGNLVTNDGYYEFDLDAAAAVIASALEAARREALPLLQLAIGALAEAREALHFHYVEWDGEPEDAVPLQLARAKCDQTISALKENTNAG